MKLASTETGSARPVITVERHELRNRNTTSTVSNAPSEQRLLDVRHGVATRSPASFTMSIFVPFGSVVLSSRRAARGRDRATSVVL